MAVRWFQNQVSPVPSRSPFFWDHGHRARIVFLSVAILGRGTPGFKFRRATMPALPGKLDIAGRFSAIGRMFCSMHST
jgi:hypothetical protein